MSECAVRVTDASKSFRRFRHPGWRALDAFGLPVPRNRYDTFTALKSVSLDIRHGERVALIGRNGAGKSTLLRIISGQMQADAGRVSVDGSVQALMELGTGFHPEFTGLQNIRAALAYRGLSGRKLDAQIDEIIDFTELEAFIERPVQEYSAGMYARLAFAVATSIEPEILIVDEILGAGDAYFVGKSIQRMKALTHNGATVLFVSHDMSSVQLLCDRAVWIQDGTVQRDGAILPVTKAYLAAVREDEEARQKARTMALTRGQAASLGGKSHASLFRLVGEHGSPPAAPFAVSSIRFGSGPDGNAAGRIEPGVVPPDGCQVIVDARHMNWKGPVPHAGRNCWQFGDFGGSFGHAPWQVRWPGRPAGDAWLALDYLPSAGQAVAIEQFCEEENGYRRLAVVPPDNPVDTWQSLRIAVAAVEAEFPETRPTYELQELSPDERYGSGEAHITGFGFFDPAGERRHTLVSGEPSVAVIAYRAEAQVVGAVAVVAVYKPDGTTALQVVSNRDGESLPPLVGEGYIRVEFDPLHLGPGEYVTSVALFKELNIAAAVEPQAYDLHDRCYTITVLPPPGIGIDLGTVNQPARFEVTR